jgi:hypothetical protein
MFAKKIKILSTLLLQFIFIPTIKKSFSFQLYLQGPRAVAGVLDEPYSQPIPLSGVAVQARQST